MTLDTTTAGVAGVLFLATLVRTTLGFGEALVAVPLLALFVPVAVAAPVAVMVSVTVASVVVVQDRRHVHVRSAAVLVAATLAGIPLGLVALRTLDETVVKASLGAVILAFALWALRCAGTRALAGDPAAASLGDAARPGSARGAEPFDRRAWLFGAAAGVLGGAYGMNGPPLVIYGSLRRWSPAQFRATLQGYFLPASLVGLAGYGLAGFWTPAVGRYYLTSLPAIALAIALGHLLHRRLDASRFRTAVHLALAAIGLLLLVEGLVAA